jgi:hypothetical protein
MFWAKALDGLEAMVPVRNPSAPRCALLLANPADGHEQDGQGPLLAQRLFLPQKTDTVVRSLSLGLLLCIPSNKYSRAFICQKNQKKNQEYSRKARKIFKLSEIRKNFKKNRESFQKSNGQPCFPPKNSLVLKLRNARVFLFAYTFFSCSAPWWMNGQPRRP